MTIVMTFIAAAVAVILIIALKGRSGGASAGGSSRRDDVHSYKRKQSGRNVIVRGYQRRSRW